MNEQLNAIIDRLKMRRPLQELSPRRMWDRELEKEIDSLNLPGGTSDKAVIALLAGLHLLNDSLDKSHSYAQEIEDDATGAYWHGLMHRMEGDYSNAKYWFRRAGSHPVLESIPEKAAESLKTVLDEADLPQGGHRETLLRFKDQSGWNPQEFTDLIAQQEGGRGADAARGILEQLQRIEMDELFTYTHAAYLRIRESR